MSASIKVDIAPVLRGLDTVNKNGSRATSSIVQFLGNKAFNMARRNAPRDTGALQRSITAKFLGPSSNKMARIAPDLKARGNNGKPIGSYALLLETGEVKGRKVLRPRMYMQKAFDETKRVSSGVSNRQLKRVTF